MFGLLIMSNSKTSVGSPSVRVAEFMLMGVLVKVPRLLLGIVYSFRVTKVVFVVRVIEG